MNTKFENLIFEEYIQGLKGDKGDDGERGEKGENGKDYVLTLQDKKEIASLIKVPIVKKIIEKNTQVVVKEQPLITEVTKEIKIENPFVLRGEDIIKEINSLPIKPDYQIAFERIIGFFKPKGKNNHGGGDTIVAGSNISITVNSNGTKTISSNATGGSGFQLPISGAVNGVNRVFEWSIAPNVISTDVSLGMIKADQNPTTPSDVNWTGTTTTTMTVPPNNFIYSTA